MLHGPKRIVCLTPETADVLYRIGAAECVVGVSCFAPPPPDRVKRPVVSVFTTIRHDVIDSLEPDLVIGFSDLQAEAARDLGRRGHAVLLTNQRTLAGVLDMIVTVGRIVGKGTAAEALAADLQGRLDAARHDAGAQERRPTIYFEEWDEPLITGIGWVSELIEAAGGRDAFADLADRPVATQRVIDPAAVIERSPEIIIASWCGKRVKLGAIRGRPGWGAIPAVREGRVHEVASVHCLQPGPVLITEGLPRFRQIINGWRAAVAEASA